MAIYIFLLKPNFLSSTELGECHFILQYSRITIVVIYYMLQLWLRLYYYMLIKTTFSPSYVVLCTSISQGFFWLVVQTDLFNGLWPRKKVDVGQKKLVSPPRRGGILGVAGEKEAIELSYLTEKKLGKSDGFFLSWPSPSCVCVLINARDFSLPSDLMNGRIFPLD